MSELKIERSDSYLLVIDEIGSTEVVYYGEPVYQYIEQLEARVKELKEIASAHSHLIDRLRAIGMEWCESCEALILPEGNATYPCNCNVTREKWFEKTPIAEAGDE